MSNKQVVAWKTRIYSLLDFNKLFGRKFLEHYMTWALPLEYTNSVPPTSFHCQRPRREEWTIKSEDNVETLLLRYKGGHNGPVLLIPGAAVTHEIWDTNLIENNFVDFLLRHGYDVFLSDHRLSPNLPACKEQSGIDDMRLDHAAAIKKVRQVTNCDNIAVFAHCGGSTSLFMGLLDGKVDGIGSLLASNVAMHPIVERMNEIKIYWGIFDLWGYIFRPKFFDTFTSTTASYLDWTFDQLLRFYPLPAGEGCRNAVCHRVSFGYGLLWRHGNLSKQIHDNMGDIVGTCNMSAVGHMVALACRRELCTAKGEGLFVTEKNVREKLNFPITFIHGDKNMVFDPSSTSKSYDYVRAVNGEEKYKRFLIKNYGHLDCLLGTNAHQDVFPIIERHFNETRESYGYHQRQKAT